MSRFADKLKDALQVTPPAMGFFRNATPVGKPRMLLVAQLAPEDAEVAPDLMKAADAAFIICSKALPAKTLKILVKAAGDAPLGMWFTGKTQSKSVEGVDFVVFDSENTLLPICDAINGKVLAMPLDLPDNLARVLNDLPVESVLVNASANGILTWGDLMRLYRMGDFITKPLLMQVPATISESEINMLWDAGVDALVVPLSGENQADFKKLRTVVDGLKLAPKRKWIKPRALVPVIKQDESVSNADDDDGSEDDE